jgi:lactoylglutathione lyase
MKALPLVLRKKCMTNARLTLIVIRSADIDRAVQIYQAIGLRFSKHAHGTGSQHYCSENGTVVFEIYPLTEGQTPTTETRLGWSVESVEEAAARLSQIGARMISPPRDSPWGRRAVFADFDEHRVEISS